MGRKTFDQGTPVRFRPIFFLTGDMLLRDHRDLTQFRIVFNICNPLEMPLDNQLLKILGGLAVHPINVAIGGFYRVPERTELEPLLEELKWGLDAAIEIARFGDGKHRVAVLVGDIATDRDAQRLAPWVPVQQLTTGGACHLELELVKRGLAKLWS